MFNMNANLFLTPLCRAELHLSSKRKRSATEEQKTTLANKLAAYHKKLHTNLLQRDASGKMKFFTNPKILLGFSDLQIQQVAEHCNELFSVSEICTVVEIWDRHGSHMANFWKNLFTLR